MNQPTIPEGDDAPQIDRRRFLGRAATLGGVVLAGRFLAACGSSSTSGAGAASTTGSTAASSSTAAAGTTVAASTASTAAATATTGAAGPTSGVIGVTLNGLNEYTKGVTTGVYEAFKGTDYKIQVVQVNYSSDQELAAAQAFIAQGVVGLVIQPNTTESAGAAAKAAVDKGIPAGNCIWPGVSDSDKYFKGVASLDSVEGGRMMGKYLKENVKPGKVAVVQGVLGQGFSEQLDKGLDEALKGSGFEIVVREQGFFDRTKATDVVATAFQAHPDLVAVVSYSASMSNGIAQWMQDNNKKGVAHVGSDCDDELVKWLKTDYLQATRYYSSAQTGKIGGTAVLKALRGESVPFETPVGQVIATAKNIDSVIAENPYMFEAFRDKVQNI